MTHPEPAPEAQDLPPKPSDEEREGYGWGV